ncbi:CUB protein, partial [Kordia sp. YSTF-M3]|nr:CUB protein [Kordia aestuariivivens]
MPTLVGDANDIGGDCFEITENINFQSGAIWAGAPIDMTNDFVIEFRGFFGTNDANGADGITFIIKNTATPEIGSPGGGMGYEGINNSLAVEFDTWQNNDLGDPFFDHLAIVSSGNNNHNNATNLAGPIQASATTTNIEDGIEHIIRIEWTAATTTIDVYFDCVLRLSYSGDIVNTIFGGITNAFFGFTGSTGGAVNLQRVCFDYVSFANTLALDDQTICAGTTVNTIDAAVTAATSYAWTPTTGVSDPTISNPTFTPTTTTTYTVNITNSCAEVIQESFTITVAPSPTANTVPDQNVCDDITNDGVAPFDFTNLDATVLGTLDPTQFTITYHLSQADADGNMNALVFPYTNTTQCEQIYVRLESDLNSDCYDTTNFENCVDSQPIANQPSDMNSCDSDGNGTEIYDFTMQEAAILDTQNAADVNITFHANQMDADTDMNPLPTTYTGTNAETIFVRVESTEAGNDCFATTSFQLFFGAFAVANTVPNQNVCDDITNDGIAPFNFTNLDATVLGTLDPTLFTITYHTSQLDADGNMNALTFPYTNTAQCEQIYVRLESDTNTACYSTTDFEICVYSQPIANQPTNMIACDFDMNGTEVFDLSTQEATILGAQNTADVNITFHADQTDADGNLNPLLTNYTATNGETIFVRVESTETGNDCFATTSFDVLFDAPPIANTVTDLNVCDDITNDGIAQFDFTNLDGIVLGTQDPNMFMVTYHTSQLNADDNINALTFPYTNTAQCEQIFVRVENNSNQMCYSTTDFQICVYSQPIANQPNDIAACDLDNNGFEIFDLSAQEVTLLGTQNAADFNITYHNLLTDAVNDINPVATMYNGTNGETIFVRIESTEVGNTCFDTTSFDLLFDSPPNVTMPSDLIVCDDDVSDGFTAIDLSVRSAEIVNNQTGFSVIYYLSQADADSNTNPLALPYTNITNPQTVFVRVDSGNSGCYVTTSLVLSVADAPSVFPATPLEYCDTDNDGFGIFNIRSTENQITGGMLMDIAVTYHETPEDADNDVNP